MKFENPRTERVHHTNHKWAVNLRPYCTEYVWIGGDVVIDFDHFGTILLLHNVFRVKLVMADGAHGGGVGVDGKLPSRLG